MRFIFRWMRRGLTALFLLGILAGSGYFFYFATTGIIEEVEFRREQARRDQERQRTATMFAPTVEAEANQLVAYQVVEDSSSEEHGTAGGGASDDTDSVVSAPEQGTNQEMAVSSPEMTLGQEVTETAVGVSPASGLVSTSTEDNPAATETAIMPSASPTEAASPTVSATPSSEPTAIAQEPTATSTQLPSATSFPTNTSLPTGIPTNTPLPSSTPSATNTETPSPTLTPTVTPTASNTPTPTLTFTPSPSPTPTYVIEGTYAVPVNTPIVPIHQRAPLLEDEEDIINVVLLGSDTSSGGIGQTDVIILVNINMKAGSVAMWHLPRDLLVYIPGYTVDRINRAFAVGRDWPGGPAELMKETILYNFGIEVDFYARVDFTDFQSIVEQLGGLTISVDCAITDWRLVDPSNTPSEAYNPDPEIWGPYWEQHTLNQGVHTLSPYMALWYARSRVTTNDFDRGRRQIDILRAMWQQARDQELFSQIETIQAGLEVVDTDMELDDILRLIPLATSINLGDVERYSLEQNVHVETWLTPDDGRSVQRPNWPAILRLAQQFVTPPTENRLSREAKVIEVIDGTWYGLGWDRVAADRMAWEGFVPTITETRDIARHEITLIYDYTGEEKGSELERLQEILRVGDSQIRIEPDANRTVDYRVVVGGSYNACYKSTSADDIPDAPSAVGD